MADRAQRGSFVIYVAAAAREGTGELEHWLAQSGFECITSLDVYDALATLATHPAPLAVIVSIDALDWNELDFFTHVPRVSADTPVYVTDGADQPAKLEAALRLGAQVFDGRLIFEHSVPAEPPRAAGPAGLLAGSLRTDVEEPAPAPRLVREIPPAPPVIVPIESDAPEEDRPAVRLVSAEQTEPTEAAVPFPWSPAPDRPLRTPPRSGSREPGKSPRESKSAREAAKEAARQAPIKLTPEELSALLEPPAGGKVQEGGT